MITRADLPHPFDAEHMARLARELRDAGQPVILVHGTGHVGKPFATDHGFVHDGRLTADRRALADKIRAALRQLNDKVVATLRAEGVAARRIPAADIFCGDTGRLRDKGAVDLLQRLLARDEVPVFHGDLVRLPDGGFKVLSSDTMTSSLAAAVRPACVAYLSDIDGVHGYTSGRGMAPSPLGRVTATMIDEVFLADSDLQDVSGGMRGKLEAALEAARHSRRCLIANGLRTGVMTAVLRGTPVTCTEIIADPVAC